MATFPDESLLVVSPSGPAAPADAMSLTWSHSDPASVDHYQVLSRTVGAGPWSFLGFPASNLSDELNCLDGRAGYHHIDKSCVRAAVRVAWLQRRRHPAA